MIQMKNKNYGLLEMKLVNLHSKKKQQEYGRLQHLEFQDLLSQQEKIWMWNIQILMIGTIPNKIYKHIH